VNILWLTWKDHGHPTAGGAEVVLRELSRRLIRDGHSVTWLTCGYTGTEQLESIDGINIIRIGRNRYIHSLQAFTYYARKLKDKFDIVIEVVNTAPYFSVFFGKKSRRFLFYHQLAGSVWFHEARPPMSYVGRYVLEPLATRLLSRADVKTITVSESTKRDLAHFGFKKERTHIISEGIQLKPIPRLGSIEKFTDPTILSLGALRAMKRTMHQISAFERARQQMPNLRLKIAGSAEGSYGHKVLNRINQSPYANDIEYLGKVTEQTKIQLMQKSHLIAVTSIKEGWGLIVTEAASQGTPAVVYDVDGLRDSVRNGETGIITTQSPGALAEGILTMLENQEQYSRMREAAWRWSKQITFNNAYKDFKKILEVA